jgi:hypothetical protein
MPEAPWIRRCSYGIKFTDSIVQDEDEIVKPQEKSAESKRYDKTDIEKDLDQSPYY